jgi:hypothetical protein
MSTNPIDTLAAFRSEFGFDPFAIHCSVTGKPIGKIGDEEMFSVLNLICESNDGADEAATDLWLRVISAMRPSLKWNKFRSESLAQMRKSDPVETLAYLVNRMFAPHNRLKGGMQPVHYDERIKAWRLIESWGKTDETNTLAYMLLEIDAKMGLDVEMPPFNWRDFFEAESQSARVTMVQGWYATLMVRWEKRLKEAEQQSHWIRHGNVLSKSAFADAFMESKPLSVTAIKKAEKKADRDFMAHIIWEVLGDSAEPPELAAAAQPNPQLVPLRGRKPMVFGVKQS